MYFDNYWFFGIYSVISVFYTRASMFFKGKMRSVTIFQVVKTDVRNTCDIPKYSVIIFLPLIVTFLDPF